MSDSTIPSFGEWYSRLVQLYYAGQFSQALEIATQEGDRYPDQRRMIFHLRACMASCAGDGAQALDLLAEASGGGYWYPASFWDDPDFDSIRDHDEFKRLRAVSDGRRAEAQALARPELAVIPPSGGVPAPLLVALHGNQGSNALHGAHWRSAADAGWLVALAQSSQVAGPDVYVWDDLDQSESEIKQHVAALLHDHGGDAQRIVLGGFSLGAETAMRLALSGAVAARGFIAVAPGGPYTNRSPELWEPLIEAGRGRGVRGVVLFGGLDHGHDAIVGLVDRLQAAGIPLIVEGDPALAHDFPVDFSARLPGWLAFVLGA